MSYSFEWQRDFREGIKEGATLKVRPVENYPNGKEVEFTFIKESGRGGSIITYEVLLQHNGIAEKCYLKELYPEHICENESLFRTADGLSLAVSHEFDENPPPQKDFSLIDSEVWKSFEQDYQNIKELRLTIDGAPLFICDAHEIYRNESTYYVKVPFETSMSLGKHIEETGKKNKDLISILKLSKELALMTEKLHNAGYLHLDIKPENLLYKSIDNRAAETLSFLDMGTVVRTEDIKNGKIKYLPSSAGYSSPEQEFRHTVDLTCPETTDIFSIGAVIFKMLTGKKPTEADCRKKEFKFGKNDSLYAEYNSCYTLFKKLNMLLCKTLSVSPSFRFQSCGEVIEQIDTILGSLTNPFDKAIDRMNTIFSDNQNDGKILFSFGDKEFEKELFPKVSYGISNKQYESLYDFLCDYSEGKRLFWIGGQGGRGKSAHLKRLAYDLYKTKEKVFAPVYIDSEKLSNIVKVDSRYANNELKKAICEALNINSTPEDLDLNISLLTDCQFAIIIDGLNELGEDKKRNILFQVHNLQLSDKSIIIISDRGTPSFNTQEYVQIKINPLNKELIRSKLNEKNKNNESLINLLSENIYLLNAFNDLNKDENYNDDDRVFMSSADVLSSYYKDILREITRKIEDKKGTTFDEANKKELIKILAHTAFASYQALTLTVDEDFLNRSFKEDQDYINAITESKLFVHPNKRLKFEHDLTRDFVIAYYLKDIIINYCVSESLPYGFISDAEIFSSILSDDILKYLGELLNENKTIDNKNYESFCVRLVESGAKTRGLNISYPSKNMILWDNLFETQGKVLSFALYSLNFSKHPMKTGTVANIIKAMALGRGYSDVNALIQENSAVKNLFLHMIVDSDDIETFLPGGKNYIGTEAMKRRKKQFVTIGIIAFLMVFVFIPIVIYSWFDDVVPHIEIEPTTPVIEGAWCVGTDFHAGFIIREKDKISPNHSSTFTVSYLDADDFIMEGFTADLYTYPEDGVVFVTWENVKPVDSSIEVTECSLKLKKGVIDTANGAFSRKNKETEISSFKLVSSEEYMITTQIVNPEKNAIESEGELQFTVWFDSKNQFTVENFSNNIVLNNFSANVEITHRTINFDDLIRQSFDIVLTNIQSISDGEKYIYIPSGIAKNEYGVHSFSITSSTFEVYEDLNIPNWPTANCELISDEVISPGGSILLLVDFSIEDNASYDNKFTSHFDANSFGVEGFTYESVFIDWTNNNAHNYWVLFSNVYPNQDFNGSKVHINIAPGCAEAINGQTNDFETFEFNLSFSDVFLDTERPQVSVASAFEKDATRFFNNENMFFIIKINDNSVLPDQDMEHIKKSIKLLNAEHDDITVERNGGTANHREYWVRVTNVSPISTYENVELQILPGAIKDSFGNLSEEIRVGVFTEENLKYYCDYKNAISSLDILSFNGSEIVVTTNNHTNSFELKSESSLKFDSTDFRMNGFTANTVIIRSDYKDTISIELTNVQFDEGVDTGTLTLYAIGEDRTVYKTSILIKKQ